LEPVCPIRYTLDTFSFYGIASDGTLYLHSTSGAITSVVNSDVFLSQGKTGIIPLGGHPTLEPWEVYLAAGPVVYETISFLDSYAVRIKKEHPSYLKDVTAACRHGDRFAFTDGARIILWHPSQPPVDVSIWGEDGCPDPMRGKVKSLISYKGYLIAWWEFDSDPPVEATWLGDSIIFWSRPNIQGQTTWHPRTGAVEGVGADLAGGFPLSIGSPMCMAEHVVSTNPYFMIVTADGTNAYGFSQKHPRGGLSPGPVLDDDVSFFAAGTLYEPWHPLILMGDQAGAVTEVEVDAELPTSGETVTVAYRADYENLSEVGGTWNTMLSFQEGRPRVQVAPGRGKQADMIQHRVGLTRTTATDTPTLHSLGITVERQSRHPAKRRS